MPHEDWPPGLRAEWIAVHVEAPSRVRSSESDIKQLADHMRLAESLGAETAVLSGQRMSEEVLTYARSRNVSRIIIGKPTHARWKDKLFGSPLDEIVRGSGDIDVYAISGDLAEPHLHPEPATRGLVPRANGNGYGASSLSRSARELPRSCPPYFESVDLVMVYLLGIVITANRTSTWPALFATLVSIAAFDFFFVPPYYTFAVNDIRHFVTFIVMFIISLVISRLTLRVRQQAEAARTRERRTAALYNLSRDLVRERGTERLSELAVKHISEVFDSQVVILVPDEQNRLACSVDGPSTFTPDQQELSVAQWVYEHRQPAGLSTDTLPGAKALYLPLIASGGPVGVVGIEPRTAGDAFEPEQLHYLEAFANQAAIALERSFLAEATQQRSVESGNGKSSQYPSQLHFP